MSESLGSCFNSDDCFAAETLKQDNVHSDSTLCLNILKQENPGNDRLDHEVIWLRQFSKFKFFKDGIVVLWGFPFCSCRSCSL